ncbi:MAG: elongation factor Ts [Clostridia bacterium]|nr:elongation factor Ts [Clostridia bacterium]MBQ5314223.1 elongation factor Ts [Oscillospiraceae bacterium]
MAFTAQDVKTLREMTNCGMMDCKKALTETNGDMDKAVEFLREKGLATAAKKAGRIAAEGLVTSMIFGNVGVVVEVNTETDFVAKNADFQKFVADVAECVAKENPADVEALKATKLYGDQTVGDALTEKIATIGENMNLRRFERYEGVNEAYIHGGGRIGVLVNFKLGDDSKASDPAFRAAAKDVAMQIAAVMPKYVKSDEVPADVVEKEKEILKAQALNEGKPAQIVDKMVVGRIQKFYKEVCLVEQPYVKDGDLTVAKFLKNVAAEIGTDIEVVKFARLEKGEGLEKRVDDFAAEVAKMAGN